MVNFLSKINPLRLMNGIGASDIDDFAAIVAQLAVIIAIAYGFRSFFLTKEYFDLAKYTIYLILLFCAYIYLDRAKS